MNDRTIGILNEILDILEKNLDTALKNKDRCSNIIGITGISLSSSNFNVYISKWFNTLGYVYLLYGKNEFDSARELTKNLYPTREDCNCYHIDEDLKLCIRNYVNKFSKYMEWRYLDKMIENYNKGINDISANEYQEKALRTAGEPNIENGLMGLCGEAGECIDILKKHKFQGHDLDREHLAEELGDVAWYLAVSADALGYDLSYILNSNVEKLKARYPDGFEAERSVNRQESSMHGIIDIDEMYGKK